MGAESVEPLSSQVSEGHDYEEQICEPQDLVDQPEATKQESKKIVQQARAMAEKGSGEEDKEKESGKAKDAEAEKSKVEELKEKLPPEIQKQLDKFESEQLKGLLIKALNATHMFDVRVLGTILSNPKQYNDELMFNMAFWTARYMKMPEHALPYDAAKLKSAQKQALSTAKAMRNMQEKLTIDKDEIIEAAGKYISGDRPGKEATSVELSGYELAQIKIKKPNQSLDDCFEEMVLMRIRTGVNNSAGNARAWNQLG